MVNAIDILGAELAAAVDRAGFMIVRKPNKLDGLSPGVRRVVDMALDGKSNVQIARALGKHRGTVNVQLLNAYRHFGVHGRKELVAKLRGSVTA